MTTIVFGGLTSGAVDPLPFGWPLPLEPSLPGDVLEIARLRSRNASAARDMGWVAVTTCFLHRREMSGISARTGNANPASASSRVRIRVS